MHLGKGARVSTLPHAPARGVASVHPEFQPEHLFLGKKVLGVCTLEKGARVVHLG